MKKTNLLRKALVMICLITLVACVSVAATIAYFTDSDAVTNTFTVGKVGIYMDELDVDKDQNQDDNKTYVEDGKEVVRDQANKYHLVPGETYVKDPKIYVNADSEDCWLFVKVVNGIKPIETKEAGKTIHDQMTAEDDNGGMWEPIDEEHGVYAYTKTVSAGEEVVVFETFTIDGENTVNVKEGETAPDGKFDIADFAEKEINVTAYAIQAAGFDGEDGYKAAWDSLNAQDGIVIVESAP